MIPFGERLATAVRAVGAPAAVGLDPHLERFPAPLRAGFEGRSGADLRRAAADAVRRFDAAVLPALAGRVAAIKVQFAFYERLGAPGYAALEQVCALGRELGLLVIGDAKRGDIASTAAAYAEAGLDPAGPLGCDALTVNPWMGLDTLEPFLSVARAHGRGLFVLARTTNPGSALFQTHGDPPAALALARGLDRLGQDTVGPAGWSSVGAVVGAQIPGAEVAALRAAMPSAWFLVPGVGAQGGGLSDALAGARTDGLGSLVVAARSVLFPEQPDARYDADFSGWIQARADAFCTSVSRALANKEGAPPSSFV